MQALIIYEYCILIQNATGTTRGKEQLLHEFKGGLVHLVQSLKSRSKSCVLPL